MAPFMTTNAVEYHTTNKSIAVNKPIARSLYFLHCSTSATMCYCVMIISWNRCWFDPAFGKMIGWINSKSRYEFRSLLSTRTIPFSSTNDLSSCRVLFCSKACCWLFSFKQDFLILLISGPNAPSWTNFTIIFSALWIFSTSKRFPFNLTSCDLLHCFCCGLLINSMTLLSSFSSNKKFLILILTRYCSWFVHCWS